MHFHIKPDRAFLPPRVLPTERDQGATKVRVGGARANTQNLLVKRPGFCGVGLGGWGASSAPVRCFLGFQIA
eukprot:3120182-Alexandrium_andersonii.AAC.1